MGVVAEFFVSGIEACLVAEFSDLGVFLLECCPLSTVYQIK